MLAKAYSGRYRTVASHLYHSNKFLPGGGLTLVYGYEYVFPISMGFKIENALNTGTTFNQIALMMA